LIRCAAKFIGSPILEGPYYFKKEFAVRYKPTIQMLLARIIAGGVIHIDETTVRLKKESGYVFVMTNLEEVVFFYKSSRTTEFLPGMLKGFKGVLVSDFYSGYDSMECLQQRCLVHIIRDLNNDMLKHPFDRELATLAGGFAHLMQHIVETIDRFGLKTRYLARHKESVTAWIRGLENESFGSDFAEGYRKRFLKNQNRLFVFLDHDGIPWNNNNAEHAVKVFAKYRRLVNGHLEEGGLSDFLTLLSVQQTCNYKGGRFLDFLLSEQTDVDAYLAG
jgi:hypothetical protein